MIFIHLRWPRKLISTGVLGLILLSLVFNKAFANEQADLAAINTCSFSGEFEQHKEILGLAKPLISNGVVFFHCDFGVIWKTTKPVIEALVISNNHASYRVVEGQSSKLKSRHSKILSNIISAFISGDLVPLQKQFTVSQIVAGSNTELLLLPKKKRIKRALQKIEVTTTSPRTQSIIMTDADGQRSNIIASKSESHSQSPLMACQSSRDISDKECTLLVKGSEPASSAR